MTVHDLRLAVEPDGDAIAVWRRILEGRWVIQPRRRAATGSLGRVRTLSPTYASSYMPEVAVAPTGTATVAWALESPEGNGVQVRALAPDGTLSAVQTLTDPLPGIGSVELTVDDAGTAVVAWSPHIAGQDYLMSRTRSAGGALGPLQTVAEGSEVTESPSTDARAAMDPNGNITFAWGHYGDIDSVRTQRRAFSGTMSQVRVVSEPSVTSDEPHLAVDAAGKATIAWRVESGPRFARTVTPGGTVGPMRQISGGAQY